MSACTVQAIQYGLNVLGESLSAILLIRLEIYWNGEMELTFSSNLMVFMQICLKRNIYKNELFMAGNKFMNAYINEVI